MQNIKSGPVNCCVAQMLLAHKRVSIVTPTELAEMMGVDNMGAGRILSRLSWRREQPYSSSGQTVYYYEGFDKVFSAGVAGRARRKLAELLDVPQEELEEVFV